MRQWIGPADTGEVLATELDVRVGGRYHIAFTAADGGLHDVSGVYQEVDAPSKLSFTWAWKSMPERESLVTISLFAQDGGTRMEFVHARFFDAAARDGHQRGWTGSLEKLQRHLEAA
jgi:uncharacterized protein YndB with AHSA1/START domain